NLSEAGFNQAAMDIDLGNGLPIGHLAPHDFDVMVEVEVSSHDGKLSGLGLVSARLSPLFALAGNPPNFIFSAHQLTSGSTQMYFFLGRYFLFRFSGRIGFLAS